MNTEHSTKRYPQTKPTLSWRHTIKESYKNKFFLMNNIFLIDVNYQLVI